jgi:hypothetical protein
MKRLRVRMIVMALPGPDPATRLSHSVNGPCGSVPAAATGAPRGRSLAAARGESGH